MNALFTLIEKFKLNTKLILGFSCGLLIALLIGLFSISSLSTMEAELENMYGKELLGISHIKEANINLIYMGRAVRQMLIAPDDAARDRARSEVQRARETYRAEMAEARKAIFRAEAIAQYEKLQQSFAKYNENLDHAMALIEREKLSASDAARFVANPEFAAAGKMADDELTALTKIKENGAATTLVLAREKTRTTRLVTMALLVCGIGLALLFGVLIGASIKRPNDRLRQSVEALAEGEVDAVVPHTDYPNEIGIMARAIQVLQGIYRKADEQRWVKSHSAEIAAELQQAEDLKSLAQRGLSRLATVLKAGHGAFYAATDDGRLNLLASYGYRERKHLNGSFAIGEGLVGQCAMEKLPITLTAPKDYIQINSGLGEAPPACIAVLPVVHHERLLGVLEIASFQQFSEREAALLDSLMPALATSMEIMDRNQRTRELLVATQEQAERMEKQAAQLEEQAVEMEAQQAELLETENWFRGIIESAPDGMLVADESGVIVLANPRAEALFGHAAGSLAGTPLRRLLPEPRQAECDELFRRCMAAGPGDAGIRISGVDQAGREFPMLLSLSPLPSRGGRGRCLSISLRPDGVAA